MNFAATHKAVFALSLLIVLSFYPCPTTVAQDKVIDIPTTPNNCEDALAILDDTVIDGQKDKQSNFIVIARLGNGERAQRLNRERLHAVMLYFKNKNESRVVLASGTRAKGLGRVELYVAGKLFHVIAFPKNKFIDCREL